MKLIATLVVSLFAVTAFAQDKGKGEPVYAKTTPNPVVAPAKEEAKQAPATKSQTPTTKDQKKTAEPAKPGASK